MIGVDPRPLTLRQLLWMAEGAQRERWARASAAMSVLANCHRDPKKGKAYTPADFDPYAKHKPSGKTIIDKNSIHLLRQAITGQ